jgi:hypothetical protein
MVDTHGLGLSDEVEAQIAAHKEALDLSALLGLFVMVKCDSADVALVWNIEETAALGTVDVRIIVIAVDVKHQGEEILNQDIIAFSEKLDIPIDKISHQRRIQTLPLYKSSWASLVSLFMVVKLDRLPQFRPTISAIRKFNKLIIASVAIQLATFTSQRGDRQSKRNFSTRPSNYYGSPTGKLDCWLYVCLFWRQVARLCI